MKILEGYDVGRERAVRYWALEGRILVGGRIVSRADAEHLRRDFGVTHVLSAESEQSDEATWLDAATRGYFPFDDNALAPPLAVILGAVGFVRGVFDANPEAVLNTHCRLAGSRGPSYAYLALRVLGFDPGRAMDFCGRRQRCGADLHPAYVSVIEQAITGRAPPPRPPPNPLLGGYP